MGRTSKIALLAVSLSALLMLSFTVVPLTGLSNGKQVYVGV